MDTDRGSAFTLWVEEWKAYSRMSDLGKENAATQYNVLRLALSRETALVVSNPGLSKDKNKKKYVASIIKALTEHADGAINETVERKAFCKRQQQRGETFEDYIVALRGLIGTCNYCSDDCSNKALLRDQKIERTRDGYTVEELLRDKKLTPDGAISVCRAHESAKVNRTRFTKPERQKDTSSPRVNANSKERINTQKKCGRCGRP